MADLPWFAYSPSPFSIMFYLICTIYGIFQLKRLHAYDYLQKHPYRQLLVRFCTAFFTLGFVICLTDAMWCTAIVLRFGNQYPASVVPVIIAIFRDIAGVILCILMTAQFFQTKQLNITRHTTFLLGINILYLALWLLIAPSPIYEDWTQAIINNAPLQIIALDFFMSHIIGKTLVFLILRTLYQK